MEIKIKTYVCSQCDYHQDFEPTSELMLLNHYRPNNICPSCKKCPLELETREDKKIKVKIADETEIDARDITEEKKIELKEKRLVNIGKMEFLEDK